MLMVLPSVLPEYFTRVLKRLNLLNLRDYFMTGVFVISYSVGPSADLLEWLLNQLVFHIQTRGYLTELQKVMGKNPNLTPLDRVRIAILTRIGTLAWFTNKLLLDSTLDANDYGKFYHGLNLTSFERLWLMIINCKTQYYESKPFGYLTVNLVFEKEYLDLLLAWVEDQLNKISPSIVQEYRAQQSWGYSPRVNGDLIMLSKVVPNFTFVPFSQMPISQFQLPIGEVIICPDANKSKNKEEICFLEKVHTCKSELLDRADVQNGNFNHNALLAFISDSFGFFVNNKIRPNKWMFSEFEMTGTVHTLDVDNVTTFSIALNMLFCTNLSDFNVFNMFWIQIYNVSAIIAPNFQSGISGTSVPFPLSDINANYNQYVFELFTGIPMHYSGSVSPSGLNPQAPTSSRNSPTGPTPVDPDKQSSSGSSKNKPNSGSLGRKGGAKDLHPKPNLPNKPIQNKDLSEQTSNKAVNSDTQLQIDKDIMSHPITIDDQEIDLKSAESVADKLENAVRSNRFSKFVEYTKDGATLLYRGVKILNQLQRLSGAQSPQIVNNLVNRISTSIMNVQHSNPALLEGIY